MAQRTSLNELSDQSSSLSRRQRFRRSEIVFKVIVALEVAFLLFMWTVVPDKIQSFSLQHDSFINKSYRSSKRNRRRQQGSRQWHHKSDDSPARQYHLQQRFRRSSINNPKIPTLFIGGSDGSGTRAITATMRKLGVAIKSDSRETLDVLAPRHSGGWARLVEMVINTTHSTNYNVENLPLETRNVLIKHVRKFWGTLKDWRGADRPFTKTKVFAGAKAPAFMVLLPILREVIPSIKYIHVVRDGRDIALSKNQSPVHKFYRYMYSDANKRINKYSNGSEAVLAMHLWNDWNTQSLQWQQDHASTNDTKFEYMVVRSEDLINPDTRLETLARLASFVGSSISPEELCEMSKTNVKDLGKSKSWNLGNNANKESDTGDDARNYEETTESVDKRYGKWKAILRNQRELSTMLHDQGSQGLAAFGYQPQSTSLLKLVSSREADNVNQIECRR